MYAEPYVETRKYHMLWIAWCFEVTRFSVPGDQNADEACPAHHSQDGVGTNGAVATRIWLNYGEKLVLGWLQQLSVALSTISYGLKVPIMEKFLPKTNIDKYVCFIHCQWCCIVIVFKNPII
jgi:hypothetical protein